MSETEQIQTKEKMNTFNANVNHHTNIYPKLVIIWEEMKIDKRRTNRVKIALSAYFVALLSTRY